jgi:hypothetical protein
MMRVVAVMVRAMFCDSHDQEPWDMVEAFTAPPLDAALTR